MHTVCYIPYTMYYILYDYRATYYIITYFTTIYFILYAIYYLWRSWCVSCLGFNTDGLQDRSGGEPTIWAAESLNFCPRNWTQRLGGAEPRLPSWEDMPNDGASSFREFSLSCDSRDAHEIVGVA